MNIKELAQISGLSVRTLHHYDRVGLLCPARDPQNSYRVYTRKELDRLQQILLFRACGFPLDTIRQLLDSPDFDQAAAFELQKKALLYEQKRLTGMLDTLNKSIDTMKGKMSMTDKEKFQGFDFSSNPYEQEARERWGDEAVNQSKQKLDSFSQKKKLDLQEGMDALFARLAGLRHQAPEGEKAQAAMADMYSFFNSNFGMHYSPEAFAGLGEMYTEDERFTKNIDRFGSGLSMFLKEAMRVYADQLMKKNG